MHESENFAPGIIFSPQTLFMGEWTVHNFMHGMFTNENPWAEYSLTCMEISFSWMKMKFHACK